MEGLRAALKEWAAVEEAMHRGRISLLLRKGGIWEPRDGFQVEHSAFLIFPGVYHQNLAELAESLRPEFGEGMESTEPDPVPLRLLARVEAVVRLTDEAAVDALAGLHPLTRAAARSRFHYRDRPYLHALLLRLHALSRPAFIRNSLAYVGCRSWVELAEPISIEGATPVLSETDFGVLRGEFERRLDGRGEWLDPISGRAR
jgi:hypothetical protein